MKCVLFIVICTILLINLCLNRTGIVISTKLERKSNCANNVCIKTDEYVLSRKINFYDSEIHFITICRDCEEYMKQLQKMKYVYF